MSATTRPAGLCLLALSLQVLGCEAPQATSALYFDQAPPGDTPVVFAPGIVSRAGRYEQFLLFAPDGASLVLGLTNADWSAFTLHSMRFVDGEWRDETVSPFLGSDSSALTASFTPDMRTVFITSARPVYPPEDIWSSTRRPDGWSEPAKLGPPISSAGDEFEVSVAADGTLYFSSSREGGFGDLDIYRAPLVDGRYPTAENLGPAINTEDGDDLPFIAPDESYLIFASNRPGGLGDRDLYVSVRVNGEWSAPVNPGAPINSPDWDIYPTVSPDGKYLFFARRTGWDAKQDSEIWWVSLAGILDEARAAAAPVAAGR